MKEPNLKEKILTFQKNIIQKKQIHFKQTLFDQSTYPGICERDNLLQLSVPRPIQTKQLNQQERVICWKCINNLFEFLFKVWICETTCFWMTCRFWTRWCSRFADPIDLEKFRFQNFPELWRAWLNFAQSIWSGRTNRNQKVLLLHTFKLVRYDCRIFLLLKWICFYQHVRHH